MKTRTEALALLHSYVSSESLRRHSLAVETCMLWYADSFNISEPERSNWGIAGLLHDFDYEKYPDPSPAGHPFIGNQILAEQNYSPDIREAIMGHANYSGVSRSSLMSKVLYAVDELSGLVIASALARPGKDLSGLEVKSVMKKFKDKAFARGCNREDILTGAAELNLPLESHIENVIKALCTKTSELGLT